MRKTVDSDCPECRQPCTVKFDGDQNGASSSVSFKCEHCGAGAAVAVASGNPFDSDPQEAERAIQVGLRLLGHFVRQPPAD